MFQWVTNAVYGKLYPGFLATPWRRLERNSYWNEEFRERLIEDIKRHKIGVEDVKNIRILLLGQISGGKSSFVNTVASIDKRRVTDITRSGGAEASLTLKLKEYPLETNLKNICILDTMGVEDKRGLHLKDILQVVHGHVQNSYEFNPENPIVKGNDGFREDPKKGDKVHCVVFVIDANTIGQDNVSKDTRRQLRSVTDELKREDIGVFVLITKIDVLCNLVEKDVKNAFISEKVKRAVDVATELYNVPKKNIFVVKNYESESERNVNMEILVLLALRQMMYVGSDFLSVAAKK